MPDIVSQVPGIVWPAILDGRGARLLALQFQLEQSQWLSSDELRARQFRQIEVLCGHAFDTVPYYRQKLELLGLNPSSWRLRNDWQRLPILSRDEIQLAGTELYSTSKTGIHGKVSASVTSGSTGKAITAVGTEVTALFWRALLLRQHLWHRRDFSLKLAAIRSMKNAKPGFQKEFISANWGLGTAHVYETGVAVTLEIHASLEEQVQFLLRHDPCYLLTYPSVVQALAEYFLHSPQKLTRLKEVRTFGEILEPKTRAICRQVWNVSITDDYSAEEVGHIATQCPDHEHYHVHAESLLVEVLRDDGQPCLPGEVGRVVITSLHNFAMPLIRYSIGDFAEVGEPCPCGRGLSVLKQIMGRQRNMFILPDGRRVWPALEIPPERQAAAPPVLQYQLIQRSLECVEMLVIVPRPLTVEEEHYLRTNVELCTGYVFPEVKITPVDEISRGPTGKYEEARCEVEWAIGAPVYGEPATDSSGS